MSERAQRRMAVAEFLEWDDGTDTRYELVSGTPVAMAPPARAHRVLSARLGDRIEAALQNRPACLVESGVGIARPDRADTCYVADLAVSCQPHQRGEQLMEEPTLVVEILSPGTVRHDRHDKVSAYRRIGSVSEILLLDSENYYAEVLRRDGGNWLTELVLGPEAVLHLDSVGLEIGMAELYRGIDIGDDAAD